MHAFLLTRVFDLCILGKAERKRGNKKKNNIDRKDVVVVFFSLPSLLHPSLSTQDRLPELTSVASYWPNDTENSDVLHFFIYL